MAWLAACFLVIGFLILLQLFGLVEKSTRVVTVTRRSLAVVRDSKLSDDEKERSLQAGAKQLFLLSLLLALGCAAAVMLPFACVWLGDRMGLLSLDDAMAVAVSPLFIAVGTVLAILVFWWDLKCRKNPSQYSTSERALHHVAFHSCSAQIAAADVEDQMFAKQLAACDNQRPVFITAIPRAGTTMLLECCAKLPEFASHCYRDMPFVLIPCLWNRFSAKFRKTGKLHERAHGDGMLIDFDSPEALEEVLWKAFWKKHYLPDRIAPWRDGENNADFNDFFKSHVRKIALVRRGDDAPKARYISKNNLNIARTAVLRRIFPKAVILVPFRDPLHHCSSLVGQHLNFSKIHKEDRFASKYMRAIGHYDFGENLCPVDFDGWFDRRESRETGDLSFWLEYWVASYRRLLADAQKSSLRFVNYDALCVNPAVGMRAVAEAVECRDADALVASAAGIHAARPRTIDVSGISGSLLQEVDGIHAMLKENAINREIRATM